MNSLQRLLIFVFAFSFSKSLQAAQDWTEIKKGWRSLDLKKDEDFQIAIKLSNLIADNLIKHRDEYLFDQKRMLLEAHIEALEKSKGRDVDASTYTVDEEYLKDPFYGRATFNDRQTFQRYVRNATFDLLKAFLGDPNYIHTKDGRKIPIPPTDWDNETESKSFAQHKCSSRLGELYSQAKEFFDNPDYTGNLSFKEAKLKTVWAHTTVSHSSFALVSLFNKSEVYDFSKYTTFDHFTVKPKELRKEGYVDTIREYAGKPAYVVARDFGDICRGIKFEAVGEGYTVQADPLAEAKLLREGIYKFFMSLSGAGEMAGKAFRLMQLSDEVFFEIFVMRVMGWLKS